MYTVYKVSTEANQEVLLAKMDVHQERMEDNMTAWREWK
jgi:hypothetical protein